MGVIDSWDNRDQEAALNCQSQSGYRYSNGQESQNSNQNSLIYTDLWHWLVDQGVPRSEIIKKSIKVLFDLCKQKSSRSREQV